MILAGQLNGPAWAVIVIEGWWAGGPLLGPVAGKVAPPPQLRSVRSAITWDMAISGAMDEDVKPQLPDAKCLSSKLNLV